MLTSQVIIMKEKLTFADYYDNVMVVTYFTAYLSRDEMIAQGKAYLYHLHISSIHSIVVIE